MSTYKISREGQELGSFDASQIQEGLQSGYFQPTDWGWSEGMADWKALPELVSSPSPAQKTGPLQGSSAPKARPIATPSALGAARAKPAGAVAVKQTGAAATNPYAAPAAQSQANSANIGTVPFPIVAELIGTKPWVRLISVLMWIGCSFFLLAIAANLIFGFMGASAMARSGEGGAGFGMLAGMLLFCGISAIVVVYPTLKLSQYASKISRLSQSLSFTDLISALREQRRFWKFYGIVTVIYLCFIGLFVILMLAGIGIGAASAPVVPE